MDIFYQDPYVQIIQGDCREVLAGLPAESIQCIITSPPYWGLRKYSGKQELIWGNWQGAYGLEPTLEMYIEHTIEILRGIRRVLREDGVVFWNIGDSYASSPPGNKELKQWQHGAEAELVEDTSVRRSTVAGYNLKPKDLCLIPLRVAIAAQEDGWWVRSVIIWSKPNPMPESVTDRPTENHDYILMLTKSARYYWDADAVREITGKEASWDDYPLGDWNIQDKDLSDGKIKGHQRKRTGPDLTHPLGRNLRSVWEFPTEASGLEMCLKCKTIYDSATYRRLPEKVIGKGQAGRMGRGGNDPDLGNRNFMPIKEARDRPLESPIHPYRGDGWGEQALEGRDAERKVKVCRCGASDWLSHFAVFPEKLPEICIKASTKQGDLVLDPLAGSGRTGKVAKDLGRKAILIDTSEDYCRLAKRRIEVVPLPMVFPAEETYTKAPEWF